MSTVVHPRVAGTQTVAATPVPGLVRLPRFGRLDRGRDALLWPVLVASANAMAFYVVRPNVSDLQAALARQSSAAHGVGLGYWFQWFGGGSTPGNYSIITPYLSSLIGALAVGALATVAITLLVRRAAAGTGHVNAATWVATGAAALNIWSGRIPFALGCAFAIAGVIGVRERRTWLAAVGIIGSSCCSPVTGAFLAFALAAVFLVEKDYRRLIFWLVASCGVTLLGIALFFGNPGPQGYPVQSAGLAAGAALFMFIAKPAPAVRVMLWCTAIAAPLIFVIPNGMGSNFSRLPWLCLPAAVVATSMARRRLVALALVPALACGGYATVSDLLHSSRPSASARYYTPLIAQLGRATDLANHRLEVVQDPTVHTGAYALLGHAALAGGWETQEQHKLNHILEDPELDATSYKVWLDNNAVGYVAFNVRDDTDSPEYKLVEAAALPYLSRVSRQDNWILYRVAHATPIVAPPQRLLAATQAQLRIQVGCACQFSVRVRYSKFLTASIAAPRSTVTAEVRDDGHGWSTVTTTQPGVYVFRGDVTRPLR